MNSDELLGGLRRREEALIIELNQVRAAIQTREVELSGVTLGQIVRNKKDNKLYRVVEIDAKWMRPWLKGSPQKADGSFGTSIRHLFDNWEVVEE